MGISAAEIEEAEGLVGGLPPEARRQQAQARLAAVAKQAPELKAHPVFTHAGKAANHRATSRLFALSIDDTDALDTPPHPQQTRVTPCTSSSQSAAAAASTPATTPSLNSSG